MTCNGNPHTDVQLATWRELAGKIHPAVENKLNGDVLHHATGGSEPQRNLEVVQSWEAVQALNSRLVGPDQVKALKQCGEAVKLAGMNYDAVQSAVRLDQKSNAEHI